jgi:hypothetical protein
VRVRCAVCVVCLVSRFVCRVSCVVCAGLGQDIIYETIQQYPKCTIITGAPLTNVGNAIRKYAAHTHTRTLAHAHARTRLRVRPADNFGRMRLADIRTW